MPFEKCIAAAVDGKLLDEDQAQTYLEIYGEELNARRGSMPGGEAAAEAGRAAFAAMEGIAAERRRQTFLALAAKESIRDRMASFVDPRTGIQDPHRAAIGVYSRILPGRNGLAVEQQHEFWRDQATAFLDGVFELWSRNWAGKRRNLPRAANIVREAFGESTGDAAAMAVAQGWKKASEFLRQGFNRFGGHIAHREDWGLPQSHNWRNVRAAGFEKWKTDVAPLLDRNRMLDRETGRALSEQRLNDVLRQVFDSIITRGWASREPTSRAGVASLANRHDDARVLHFANADSWLAYQRQYGEGDPINTMLGHIDHRARSIGIMQVMGPNPNATLAWMKNSLSKISGEAGDDRSARYNRILDRLHVNYTRSNAAPENPVYADLIDDASNIATAAQLGSAIVMAVPTDINFQRIARGFNGLPEWQALTSYLRRLDPTSPVDRFTAMRLGLGAQHFAQVLGAQGRYAGEIYGHGATRWIADRVLAASGLTPWTSAGRSALGTDVFMHVAHLRKTAWADLDEDFRGFMARYGVDAMDWKNITATPVFKQHGRWIGREVDFIRPADIMERQDLDPGYALDLASKLQDAAQSETEFAVPSDSLETMAIAKGFDAPGSFGGSVRRSFAKYKNFGTTMMLTHGRRSMSLANPRKKGSYAAALFVSSTIAGALGMMAKDIVAGRQPRSAVDKDGNPDWRFWAAAAAAGGGAGILGDFAYAGVTGGARSDQGLSTTLAGPLVGIPADIGKAAFGNPLDPSGASGAMAKGPALRWLELAKRYTPGTNIWWARLAQERFIWDNLQEGIDPGWRQRVSRIESFYRRQYGQEFYWHHGEGFPSEAPDPSAAVGGDR